MGDRIKLAFDCFRIVRSNLVFALVDTTRGGSQRLFGRRLTPRLARQAAIGQCKVVEFSSAQPAGLSTHVRRNLRAGENIARIPATRVRGGFFISNTVTLTIQGCEVPTSRTPQEPQVRQGGRTFEEATILGVGQAVERAGRFQVPPPAL